MVDLSAISPDSPLPLRSAPIIFIVYFLFYFFLAPMFSPLKFAAYSLLARILCFLASYFSRTLFFLVF